MPILGQFSNHNQRPRASGGTTTNISGYIVHSFTSTGSNNFNFQKGSLSFSVKSFYQVAYGLGLLNINKENLFKYQRPDIKTYINNMNLNEKQFSMDHKKFLKRLKNGIF